jgi:hypothetical protein
MISTSLNIDDSGLFTHFSHPMSASILILLVYVSNIDSLPLQPYIRSKVENVLAFEHVLSSE